MFTTDTCVHGQNTSDFSLHCLVKAIKILLINAILAFAKQRNTEYDMFLVCANMLLVDV